MEKTLTLGLIVLLLLPLVLAGGMGISPPRIIEPNALAGSSFSQVIAVSRTDSSSPVTFSLYIPDDLQSWIEVEPLVLDRGQNRKDFDFLVSVPEGTAPGDYGGELIIRADPGLSTAATKVTVGIPIAVDIHVSTDEYRELRVSNGNIPNIHLGQPLTLHLSVNNRGNGEDSLTNVSLIIHDKFKSRILHKADSTDHDVIPPFTVQNTEYTFFTNLPSEQYWAHVTAYRDQTVLYDEQIVFDITFLGSTKGISLVEHLDGHTSSGTTPKQLFVFMTLIVLIASVVLYDRRNV